MNVVTDRNGCTVIVSPSARGDEVNLVAKEGGRSAALYYTPAQAREVAAALLRAADEVEGK